VEKEAAAAVAACAPEREEEAQQGKQCTAEQARLGRCARQQIASFHGGWFAAQQLQS